MISGAHDTFVRLICGLGLAFGLFTTVAGVRGTGRRLPPARHPRPKRRDETQLVESLAIYIEQLRDTIAGARGLEQSISATANTAPLAIRDAVRKLAARTGLEDLSVSLRAFADEIDHPLADFVAAALIAAAQHQVRDLSTLLGHLANSCRDDVRMRTRVWVARARLRSAVKIIGVVIALFVVGLAVLDREYLQPYATVEGAVVLAIVAVLFGMSLTLLQRMSRLELPNQFIGRPQS